MSQHDYIIDNALTPAFRSDLNSALGAIVSNNSGATAPSTTYADMFWYDSTNYLIKMRNDANSAWITLGTVDQTNSKFEPNQTFATLAQAQAGTDDTKAMNALRVTDAITTKLNVSGSAPMYACRAWVNFYGIGTVSIRASGNVSSVVRNSAGNYTVNFATAMPDANYCAVATAANVTSGADLQYGTAVTDMVAGSCRISGAQAGTQNHIMYDQAIVSVAIFR